MNSFVIILIIVGAIGIIEIVLYLIRKQVGKNQEINSTSILREDIKEIREGLKEAQRESLDFIQQQQTVNNRIIQNVTSGLEKVHADNQRVAELKGQLDKLTDVLANPKQRGILGEYFLETLLKNIFQPQQYQLQYRFSDGEIVDAIIFLKEKILPIDAKFSLENYNKILEEKNPVRKEEFEKIFKKDLKNRIEETSKYIRPEEGTMDFAFMFIPSEGIYYDLLINQIGGIKSNTYDLIEYAFKEKRVIIVSPTSFYAYLQTVLQGLKAFQIEKSTEKIIKRVETLQKHIINYDIFLKKLGNNLSTTINTYNQTYKEFGKINKDAAKLTNKEKTVEPLQLEKPNHLE
ncbi:MAG: DNA recombination protein RmuC [Patescibacteria group bacterium]|nr:DNA recombination protein RmuC [Patescibacteria group bacterium]MBU1877008.1 DNA recombination protein RmuC [Patescibacteria group bacterium]